MIVFIICAVVGSFFLGFIACALLSAERVIPRLPKTQLLEQAYKNGYKRGVKGFLDRMREEVALSNAWFVDYDDVYEIAEELLTEMEPDRK